MKKFLFLLLLNICIFPVGKSPFGKAWLGSYASAQTAVNVLDKCAAQVGAKGGAQANFHIAGSKFGNHDGNISIKGNKFCAHTGVATVWFDGKTQWSYFKKTNEVNVSSPTAAQQAKMNPLTFINMYKKGYTTTLRKVDGNYEVHLVAQNKNAGIAEAYIVVDSKTYAPQQVRMRQKQEWTTINISDFKACKQSDSNFKFNKSDFPTAEVVDLR